MESNPYMVDANVLFSMRQLEALLSKVSKVLTVADIALDSNGEYGYQNPPSVFTDMW